MISSGTSAKVQGYIDDVLNGDIVVCDLVRKAVQRHVDDLADTNSPFWFDPRLASAACDFFPIMLRHSIGDYAGRSFELEPWQAFGIWNIFGWKRHEDDSRRFRKFYWSMARKNGKSSLAAGIALFLAMMDVNPTTGRPEDVAEVILCATKKEQVEKVIYAEIERMRLRSPQIAKLSTTINKQITFKHNHGSIRCVGSDKPYDGLNPHSVMMDELHAWKEHHRKFYDTMLTGSGYRRQPLIGTVTTAGDDQSHLWKEEYYYAKGILDGTIKDDSVFAFSFELDEDDDPLDEDMWIKANPNLHVSVRIDYIRQLASEAREKSLALNRFIRYHGNRIVSSTEKAFDMRAWDACPREYGNWREAAVGAGVDLGGRDDLAAYALCARFPIGEEDGKPLYRFEIKTKAYIAHDTERDLTKQPFADWIHEGYVNKCTYPTSDLKADLMEELLSMDNVHAVAYDPYNAQQLGDELTAEGVTAARMAQNCSMQNEPIKEFIDALRDGRIVHGNNPLLRWCANNAVVIRDRTDRWMLDKRDSNDKIDPIVACVMAFRMACLAPEAASGSLYIS